MPFTLIQGSFHVLHPGAGGNLRGFQPDGDSIHFKADNFALMTTLKVLQSPLTPSNIGSVNLRLEGIDAFEIHFSPGVAGTGNTRQPKPGPEDARDSLIAELKLAPVVFAPPLGITARPPAPNDGARGYILSRSLDIHGRPVSFAFAGDSAQADGSSVFLNFPLLKQSANFKLVLNGFTYPLFYDTLFKSLRTELATAAVTARNASLGLWASDVSRQGLTAQSILDLETDAVIFPKLFRRLTSYFAHGHSDLSQFLAFPEVVNEQVQDLDPASPEFTNFTHFDSMIDVQGNTVSLKHDPETMLFISQK